MINHSLFKYLAAFELAVIIVLLIGCSRYQRSETPRILGSSVTVECRVPKAMFAYVRKASGEVDLTCRVSAKDAPKVKIFEGPEKRDKLTELTLR